MLEDVTASHNVWRDFLSEIGHSSTLLAAKRRRDDSPLKTGSEAEWDAELRSLLATKRVDDREHAAARGVSERMLSYPKIELTWVSTSFSASRTCGRS